MPKVLKAHPGPAGVITREASCLTPSSHLNTMEMTPMKPKAIRSILALALLVGLVLAVAPVALAVVPANPWTVDAAPR